MVASPPISAIGAVLHHIAPQRKGLPVTAYRLGAVFTLAVAIAFSAQAQIIVHGNDFPAGEATPRLVLDLLSDLV